MIEKQFECHLCPRKFTTEQGRGDHITAKHGGFAEAMHEDTEPDWGGTCENCGASPIVPLTGLCGPCTWGEAATAGGNW